MPENPEVVELTKLVTRLRNMAQSLALISASTLAVDLYQSADTIESLARRAKPTASKHSCASEYVIAAASMLNNAVQLSDRGWGNILSGYELSLDHIAKKLEAEGN